MTVAIDAVSQGSLNNGASLTFSHTVGSGTDRALYVLVDGYNSADLMLTGTVSYGGVDLGAALAVEIGNGSNFVRVYRLLAPASGTANIVLTPSSLAYLHVYAISLTGVDQVSPEGTIATSPSAITNSNSPIATTVTVAAGGAAIDMVTRRTTGSLTPDAAQTRIGTEISAGGVAVSGSSYQAADGNVAMSWTFAALSNVSHLVVPLNPAAGGAELSGGISLAEIDSIGSLASNVALLTGDLTIGDVLASGALGLTPGSIRTLPFARNNGTRPTGLINVAIAVLSDDASLLRLAGSTAISQNGDGTVSFSGAGLPGVGTSVIVLTREPDGKIGAERYLVA